MDRNNKYPIQTITPFWNESYLFFYLTLKLHRILLIGLFIWNISVLQARVVAFPGAEGFGCNTVGGRGGQIIEVTNLNNAGPGSLRAAVNAEGSRIVVFRVSGTIALQSELVIHQDSITVAGQTAPGDGICLRNYPLIIGADEVILRFLRIRLGDEKEVEGDGLSAMFQKNIIIDHCSISWGTDETATVRDNVHSTVQWCIISESLNRSCHHKGPHGYGGIWGGMGATFHHNLLAHHSSRNPRFNGSRYNGHPEKEIVDFRNNVVYNWGFNSGYGGEAGNQNVVANYYKYGPATQSKDRIVEPWDDRGRWYVADNFVYGFPKITFDNWAGGVQGKFRDQGRVDEPFPCVPVVTQSAEEAYALVLDYAGAVLPKRDAVDARIIEEVRTGTAQYGQDQKGIVDSQTDVGGWPLLRTCDVRVDMDHDGMADDWELIHHLDPSDPSDRNGDNDGDGYTNVEAYLNTLAQSAQPPSY